MIERMAGDAGNVPEQEMAGLWSAILDGKWRLVDCFDNLGRHYFVARESRPDEAFRLSRTEKRVLNGVGRGDSNKQIAYGLQIAESTVATHLSRALKKMAIPTRATFVMLYSVLASVRVIPQ